MCLALVYIGMIMMLLYSITRRLCSIASPVLRSHILVQTSQLVDLLILGDSSKELINAYIDESDDLSSKLLDLQTENEELKQQLDRLLAKL